MGIIPNWEKIENQHNCEFIKNNQYSCFSLVDNTEVNNNFFTFLIENRMNRYLFGYISKNKNLRLDTFSFNDKLLDEHVIEEICGESFIKKYSCKNCGHLLFRKHLYEIKDNENFELDCPNCGKFNNFSFSDLENDFEIKRVDLIKFFERLVDINVFSKRLVGTCSSCVEIEKLDDLSNFDLICSCGNEREIRHVYDSNYDFLIDGSGDWFEWYVYNLCKNIYPHVFLNYGCEYVIDENNFSCEIDVLVFNQEDKVLIYECKDYMKKSDKISFKDFGGNLNKFNNFADIVYITSSFSKFNNKSKQESINLFKNIEINFLEGTELEEMFLKNENIITFFEEKNFEVLNLFDKLQYQKKKTILINLLNSMIVNEDVIYLEILRRIFIRSEVLNILDSEKDLIKNSIEISLNNIYDDKFVSDSLYYLYNLIRIMPSIFESNFDLNKFINFCTNFLNPDPFVGYEKRAPFYYFICLYFKEIFKDEMTIDIDIAQNFLLRFIPMVDIYHGNISLKNTLFVFKSLWAYKNSEIENKLISKIIFNYNNVGFNKKNIYSSFIKNLNREITRENKERLFENGIMNKSFS